MSDLNKKNINYGALNRFYQDLKSHDLSDLNDKIDNIDVPEYVAGEGIAIDSDNTISCTVKPISDVSALPDAEANKDSVLRLEGDEQVYISKATPITPTNRLSDDEQIDKAIVWYDEAILYYKGLFEGTFGDSTHEMFVWYDDNYDFLIVTEVSAENCYNSTKKAKVNSFTIDLTNKTFTTSENYSDLVWMDISDEPSLHSLIATYNATESSMIGNAYLTDLGRYNNISYNAYFYYTGQIVTIDNKTYYLWKSSNNLWVATDMPASEIYKEDVNYGSGEHNTSAYIYNYSDGTITNEVGSKWGDGSDYIPQLNAPDSEQVGHIKLTIVGGNTFESHTYTGVESTIQISGDNVTVYSWESTNSPTIYSTKRAADIYMKDYIDVNTILSDGGNPGVHFYINNNGTIEEVNVYITKYVKYQRTHDWNWQRVVTKDELYQNESTFTGATLTVDGTQQSIVASGTTTIVWDDLAASIPSGKSVEVSVVLINTGSSALTPTMQGNYQMMGDGNLTIQASELGLYRGRYISALNKWLIEAIYQEVSGTAE